jgi:hypothetical protein
MAPCALTLYWPEAADVPQDAAAPLLGWAWASPARDRCTVVVSAPAAPRCSGAELECVGTWLPPGVAVPRRYPTSSNTELFVTVSALAAGAPLAPELCIMGQRVIELDVVVVLYQARALC